MSSAKRILFFHLLNDYSGSPKVLMQTIEALDKTTYEKHIFSTFNKHGFLSNCSNTINHHNPYQYYSNAYLRLIAYTFTQFMSFVKGILFFKKNDWVYINTLLPFGAALAAKLKGSKVTYHIHESSIQPRALHKLLCFITTKTANEVIYVSRYVKSALALHHPNEKIIYNAIDADFLEKAEQKNNQYKTIDVLLIASLKEYKGILDFVKLAGNMPLYSFCMVLNASDIEVEKYFKQINIPYNLDINNRKTDLHPYFSASKLVVNLSHPDRWIETFGLTILEAMAYKLPCIVPPIGGVLEVVIPDESAFCTSVKNLYKIEKQIKQLLEDKLLYERFSKSASLKLKDFLPQKFNQSILKLAI